MGQTVRQLSDPGIDPASSEGLSHYGSGQLLRSPGIADLLRETRLKYGLSLAAVAEQLRIRQPYLEAIEEARFAELPPAAYGSGFVRSYAEFLGLDGEEVVRRFRHEAGRSGPAELVFPTLKSEAGIPGGAIVLLSLLLAGLAYGAWFLFSERDKDRVVTVQPAPPQLTQLIGDKSLGTTPPGAAGVALPPAPAPAPPAPAAAAPPPPPPPEEVTPQAGPIVVTQTGAILTEPPVKPVPPTAVAAATPPATPASAAAPAPPVTAAAAAPAPSATTAQAATPPPSGPLPVELSGARVVLQARLESWVQILGPDGNTLFTKVLRAGEFYGVPTQPAGLTLVTGNAGGLDIWLDGRRLAPLGPIGVVRRNVPLDPAKLRQDTLSGQAQ
jgi:cytoskeleton protein RodZ